MYGTHASMHVHVHTHTHKHTCAARTHAHTHTHTHTHACTRTHSRRGRRTSYFALVQRHFVVGQFLFSVWSGQPVGQRVPCLVAVQCVAGQSVVSVGAKTRWILPLQILAERLERADQCGVRSPQYPCPSVAWASCYPFTWCGGHCHIFFRFRLKYVTVTRDSVRTAYRCVWPSLTL